MGTPDVSISPDDARHALEQLLPATADAYGAASEAITLLFAQTLSKWGSEDGPLHFWRRYNVQLGTSHVQLRDLEKDVGAFVDAVGQALKLFETVDDDAAAASELRQSRLTHETPTPPAEPPTAPPGQQQPR